MRISIMAAICAGAIAIAGSSQAAPLTAAGTLGANTTRAAIDENLGEGITEIQYRRHRASRHHGWYRGHHRGWRPRHYGWQPRYYGPPRYYYRYGYAPPRAYRYYW